MIDELEPPPDELAGLYASAKSIPALNPETTEVLLQSVHAKIGLTAASAALTTAGSAGLSLGAKGAAFLALGTFVAGALVGVVGTNLYHGSPERPDATDSEVPDESNPVPVQTDSGSNPVDGGVSDARAPDSQGSDVEVRADRPPALNPAVAEPTAPTEGMGNTSLDMERRHLEAARAALARGRPSDALAQTARHRARFPDGELSEERDALRVEAFVRAGQLENAQAEAARFSRRYPSSLYRGRINRLLE